LVRVTEEHSKRSPRVVAGVASFAYGSYHQWRCHATLAALRGRKSGRVGTRGIAEAQVAGSRSVAGTERYSIPRGGWFEFSSTPHYFAECVLYAGMATVAGARAFSRLAPMLLAIVANLALAARHTHAWYARTFPEYPKNRWAMIPGVL
jgi:3-oxo-5-alpha-steroid 4-dehydrogenase 3